MRKVMILVTMGAIIIMLTSSVQAEIEVNESIDISRVDFVPCAYDGLGELVALEGKPHTLITFTINGSNVSGKTHSQPQGISGVGLDSGDHYQGTGVTQDHFSGSFNDGQYNETFINKFRIIGQGPGNNYLIHENFHLTVNADGEVSTTHDNVDVECK